MDRVSGLQSAGGLLATTRAHRSWPGIATSNESLRLDLYPDRIEVVQRGRSIEAIPLQRVTRARIGVSFAEGWRTVLGRGLRWSSAMRLWLGDAAQPLRFYGEPRADADFRRWMRSLSDLLLRDYRHTELQTGEDGFVMGATLAVAAPLALGLAIVAARAVAMGDLASFPVAVIGAPGLAWMAWEAYRRVPRRAPSMARIDRAIRVRG